MSIRPYLNYIQIGSKVYNYNHSVESFLQQPETTPYGPYGYGVPISYYMNRYFMLNIYIPKEDVNEIQDIFSSVNSYIGMNLPENLKIKITNE